jgi:hypothetical protein
MKSRREALWVDEVHGETTAVLVATAVAVVDLKGFFFFFRRGADRA